MNMKRMLAVAIGIFAAGICNADNAVLVENTATVYLSRGDDSTQNVTYLLPLQQDQAIHYQDTKHTAYIGKVLQPHCVKAPCPAIVTPEVIESGLRVRVTVNDVAYKDGAVESAELKITTTFAKLGELESSVSTDAVHTPEVETSSATQIISVTPGTVIQLPASAFGGRVNSDGGPKLGLAIALGPKPSW